MRQIEPLFLLLYGIVTVSLAWAPGIREETRDPAVILGCTGAACIVAALALHFTKRGDAVPSRRWIWALLAMVLLEWAILFSHFPRLDFGDATDALLTLPSLVLFAAAAGLLLGARPDRLQGARQKRLASILIGSMIVGAALILISLFLEATEQAAGWQILTMRARWITYEYDLARVLPETFPSLEAARAFYGVGGSAVYLLAIVQAIVVAGALVSRRTQRRRLSQSRLLPWLAATSCFTTFYLFNDVYWGWLAALMDESTPHWPTWTGLALQFAALLAVLVAALAALRQKDSPRTLIRLQVAQLPIAGFNFLMMAYYFQRGAVYLPGLALLMIGSQLLTWSCLGAMLCAESERASEDLRPEKERKPR